MREGDVEGAMETYRALIARNADDGAAWLGLGRALHQVKRYREAVAAHERAAASPSERAAALFNLACGYALLGQKEKAIDSAEKAVGAGLRARWYYEHDPDLASVRDEPRFKTLVSRL
jgi:tetratricopeptide (TPR) repeat protein